MESRDIAPAPSNKQRPEQHWFQHSENRKLNRSAAADFPPGLLTDAEVKVFVHSWDSMALNVSLCMCVCEQASHQCHNKEPS